jgi:glycosyltransferase involved in cell wall biosynthesis
MRRRLRRAQRILLNRGCRKIILYIWRPEFAPALDLIDYDLSCYHIDDEYTFSKVEKPISEHEMELLLGVNQVFIHSPALLEKKGHLNPHTTFVPNGVDYEAYANPCSEPEDMKPIPHPRIGYVGVIKKQVDLALLITLAKRHPQWSLVLVGPQRNKDEIAPWLQQLKKLPNVFLLGPKAVRALPGYTQHMDVCMLCYELNDYTKFIYPLKLHEYLASGRPVVGSPIRSLLEFSHVVKLARTAEEWSQALLDSLSPNNTAATKVKERQRVAQEYDWNHLVKTIAFSLGERLGHSYVEQLRGINSLNNEP